MRILSAVPALALLLTACGTGETLDPTLSAIHAEVLRPSCGFSSCHGGPNPESGLDFTSVQTSYDTLVGVDGEDANMVRVVAGDAQNSLLYRTMLEPIEGVELMPKGNVEPMDQYILDAIEQWIDDGAELN